MDKILLEPFEYLKSIPGKNIRTLLIDALNIWLLVDEKHLEILKDIISSLHVGSMIIDDIEDSSDLRRGAPAAHKVYGVPLSINCSCYVYMIALAQISQFRNPDMNIVFSENMKLLHKGQGMDIYWRDAFICPSEEEYLEMISYKTGGLFKMALELMQQCSTKNKDTDYSKLIHLLGLYFQIRDDYMNLSSQEYSSKKGFCEDLTEGKFSFLTIHSINNSGQDTRLFEILRQRTESVELKREAIDLMKETDTFNYTTKYINCLEQDLRKEIELLGGNPHLTKLIDKLSLNPQPSTASSTAASISNTTTATTTNTTNSTVASAGANAVDPTATPTAPTKIEHKQ
ncbi:Geranylgeranyl pyrophosphate synthase [Mycoemilia scoparia]|uniref:Geranylgeranyl pyrophosphate synthase n=1 Tax=Mycoemilia scoparia TaxID=417184 RepID=A0A9W8A5M9_9FUNG|nr:Geranylgeranyl pyrophosphate synthase [Mycoemilia scoparia]